MTGYVHPGYAASLADHGIPHFLPRSQGWILERPIPDFPDRDAMGCYPLFACQDWSQLAADLDDIRSELVSLALVADPFGNYDTASLCQSFDKVIAFKAHFVVDLLQPIGVIVSKHHRYYARKALRSIDIEIACNPLRFVDEWTSLYATLIQRHKLTGIKAFSRRAFEKQLSVPGAVLFRAVHRGMVIGAHLWYVQGDVAYSHLEATSSVGYELMAAYALYWSAVGWFRQHVRWLDIGAGAGAMNDGTDGLSQFKRGWATGTRPAFFCGRIFDRARYLELSKLSGASGPGYFPAYRKGELA